MDKKNIYTTLFIVLGVLLIFATGIYSGWIAKDIRSAESLRSIFNRQPVDNQGNNQQPSEKTAVAQERKAVLSFMPLSGEQKIGQSFETKVILDTQGQRTYGVDVLINYDPMMLELAPEGTSQTDQSGNTITKQWGAGKIVFSYLAPARATWQNEVELTTLVFTPKKTGQADLKFVFEQGRTFDCNVAGPEGKDILEKVFDARFEIVE